MLSPEREDHANTESGKDENRGVAVVMSSGKWDEILCPALLLYLLKPQKGKLMFKYRYKIKKRERAKIVGSILLLNQ